MAEQQQKQNRTGLPQADMELLISYISGKDVTEEEEKRVGKILNRKSSVEDVLSIFRTLRYYDRQVQAQTMKRIWIFEEIMKDKLGISKKDLQNIFDEKDKEYEQLLEENRKKAEEARNQEGSEQVH